MLAVHIVTLLSALILSVLAVEKEWADITSEATLNLIHLEKKSYYLGSIFKGTYHQAQQFCRYHGMHLLSIESQEENDFLHKEVLKLGIHNERFWTSGTRLPDGVNWIWMSTGRPLIYTNWKPGEPNDARNYDEQCVEVATSQGKLTWNDVNCTRRLNFICEISWPKDCYNLLQEMNATKAPSGDSLIDLRV